MEQLASIGGQKEKGHTLRMSNVRADALRIRSVCNKIGLAYIIYIIVSNQGLVKKKYSESKKNQKKFNYRLMVNELKLSEGIGSLSVKTAFSMRLRGLPLYCSQSFLQKKEV